MSAVPRARGCIEHYRRQWESASGRVAQGHSKSCDLGCAGGPLRCCSRGTSERFQGWLDAVAEGERQPRRNRDGSPILDANGNPVLEWLRSPDPGYAMRLLLDVAEYHIPRLARTEINGELGLRGTLIIDG